MLLYLGPFLLCCNLMKQHFDENNVDEKCLDLIMDVLSTDGANGILSADWKPSINSRSISNEIFNECKY